MFINLVLQIKKDVVKVMKKVFGFFFRSSVYFGFLMSVCAVFGINLFIITFFDQEHLDIIKIISLIVVFPFSIFIFENSKKNGPLDHWETWSKVFTFFPIIVVIGLSTFIAGGNTFLSQKYGVELPIAVELYWLAGFFGMLSLIIFHLTSPKVFKYKNYRDFETDTGSFLAIWHEIQQAKSVAISKLKAEKSDELLYDFKTLNKASKKNICPNIFYLTRKHLKYESVIARNIVGLLLMPAAYILPSIIGWNSAGMLYKTVKHIVLLAQ